MEVEVLIINALLDGEHGGNPAGVVLDADRLAPAEKLKISAASASALRCCFNPWQDIERELRRRCSADMPHRKGKFIEELNEWSRGWKE